MTFSRTLRRFAALAAGFGIALQALWPAIAQAAPKDSISVPVCSVGGVQHEIELPLGKTSDGTQHCKLCVLGTDKDLADFPRVVFDLPVQVEEPVLARATHSNPASPTSLPRSRAPPIAS